jgi:hypothetical protein
MPQKESNSRLARELGSHGKRREEEKERESEREERGRAGV